MVHVVPEPPDRVPELPPSFAAWVTELLVVVGRWRRRRTSHDSARFAYSDPPAFLAEAILDRAVPQFPPESVTLDELGEMIDLPRVVARAWLWTVALHRAVFQSGLVRRIRGLRETSLGFVASGGDVRLACIFYVQRSALAQAAPLWVRVDGARFPVVLRPVAKDVPARSAWSFPRGVATCTARLQSWTGVLTAAHVVAPNGDKHRLRQGDSVDCIDVNGATRRETVLAADAVMDAALVKIGVATGQEMVLPARCRASSPSRSTPPMGSRPGG